MTDRRTFRLRPVRLRTFAAGELADGESDVPFRRWVHVVPFGTQTLADRDETFEFDASAAATVIRWWEHYRDHDRGAIFDWAHGSLSGTAPPESAGRSGTVLGWEIRDNGLWALGEFTERAAALIRSGDYDHVSPEIWSEVKDLDTDEWAPGPAIQAVALTARPALAGLGVLAASTRFRAFMARLGETDARALLGRIERAVDDLALSGALGDLGGMMHAEPGGDRMQWAVHVMAVDPDWLSARVHNKHASRFFDLGLGESDGSLTIDSIRELELAPKTDAGDAGAGAQTMADARQTDGDRTAAILAAVGDATPEAVAAALALAQAAQAAGAGTPAEVEALATRRRVEGDAVALLQAEVASRDGRLAALETEAKALREERAERTAQDLVARYEGQGRIVPASRAQFLDLARRDPAVFAALADTLPVVANFRPAGTAAGAGGDEGGRDGGLHALVTAEALRMAGGDAAKAPELYAAALDKVRIERPEEYRAYMDCAPPMNVVRLDRQA